MVGWISLIWKLFGQREGCKYRSQGNNADWSLDCKFTTQSRLVIALRRYLSHSWQETHTFNGRYFGTVWHTMVNSPSWVRLNVMKMAECSLCIKYSSNKNRESQSEQKTHLSDTPINHQILDEIPRRNHPCSNMNPTRFPDGSVNNWYSSSSNPSTERGQKFDDLIVSSVADTLQKKSGWLSCGPLGE